MPMDCMFIIDFPIEEIEQRLSEHRRKNGKQITGVDLAGSDKSISVVSITTNNNEWVTATVGTINFNPVTRITSVYTPDGWWPMQ